VAKQSDSGSSRKPTAKTTPVKHKSGAKHYTKKQVLMGLAGKAAKDAAMRSK